MELLNTATRLSFSHCTIADNGHIFGYAHDIQSAAPTNRYRACAPNAVGHHLVRWFRPSVYLISTQNMCWLRWRNTANGHASRWRRSFYRGLYHCSSSVSKATFIPIVNIFTEISQSNWIPEISRPGFAAPSVRPAKYICWHSSNVRLSDTEYWILNQVRISDLFCR